MEIAVFVLGIVLIALFFGFGSYFKDMQVNAVENDTIIKQSTSTRYAGAITHEQNLPELQKIYGNIKIVESNIKPLATARSYNESDFVVALIEGSRNDDIFDEIHNNTFERVIKNFEFTGVKYTAVANPEEIKTALYYFDLMQARDVEEKDGVYYFKEGKSDYEGPVTLTGFGDVMLGRHVRTLMDQNGLDYPFGNIGDLKGTDFVHANLEGPIKEFAVPTSKSISFRFKPDVVWPLKDSGINIVTIANNHALDQGWNGRDDTKKFLNQAGIRHFGHPKNTKDDNVYIGEIADKKVAFIGYDDTIFKVDGNSARELITELEDEVDLTVVSIHWGAEYKHQPLQRKVYLAHLFADSGADLVIGHHPHVVQTMEIYNDVPIFYSLGNFVFDQYWSLDTQEGIGIGAEFYDDRQVLYLYPYKLPNSQPEFMVGDERVNFLEKFIEWGDYSEDMAKQIRSGKVEILYE